MYIIVVFWLRIVNIKSVYPQNLVDRALSVFKKFSHCIYECFTNSIFYLDVNVCIVGDPRILTCYSSDTGP